MQLPTVPLGMQQQKGLLMQLVMELAGEVDGGTSSCMEAVLLEESKTIHSL